MVVKVYISGISGNKEVKKRQQRVMMILDSKNVAYDVIDITEPGKEDDKEFMQSMSKARDSKYPLPPQIFNEEDYCGDYEDFDLANEIDELEKFLLLTTSGENSAEQTNDNEDTEVHRDIRQNGNTSSREASTDKDVSVVHTESELNERQNSTVEDTDDKSKSVDDDLSTKSQADDADQMEESSDKNEEKSDDQEKEE